MRRGAKPTKPKVKGKPPAARRSLKNESSRVRDLEERLAEALEQQTATAEILRVISSSPTELQPVMDVVAENAARVCGADDTSIALVEENEVRRVAWYSTLQTSPPTFAAPLRRDSVVGRAVLEARMIHIPDIVPLLDTEYPATKPGASASGARTLLVTPLLRQGIPIGTILIRRLEVQPFTDRQIELLKTFADQAVIAIENVRLFTELQEKNRALTQAHSQVSEALERQTATSEILRAISSSPTNAQPVFDAIVESAARLCSGESAAVYRFEGEVAYFAAGYHFSSESVEAYHRQFPRPLRETDHLQRVADGSVLNIPDIEKDPHTSSRVADIYRARGVHSTVLVPMVREGRAIGAIGVSHHDLGAFSEERVGLLKTFADQAVIAIENVRLFKELQSRNAALTESLERQTATAEILSVISRSPTDLQPVLEAVAENASRLCSAANVSLYRVEGDLIRKVAERESGPQLTKLRVGETRPITRTSVSGRAIIDRTTIHVRDHQSPEVAAEFPDGARRDTGIRTTVGIPLLREGIAIGAFTVYRIEHRPFSDNEIELLKTFADQAVIAIENVRLFKELEARNRDLTATSEILQVISRSPTDVQPVLETVAESAARLCEAYDTSIFRLDGDWLRRVAHHGPIPAGVIGAFTLPLVRGSFTGRSVLDGRIVHIADGQTELNEFPEGSEVAQRLGFRTILCVPLIREGVAIGTINLRRTEVRLFTERQVALLQTFADQAVIAIENVRLFTELQASNRELTTALDQQTATSDILRVISQSQTDVQPVFDAILGSAVRLLGGHTGALTRVSGDQIELAALTRTDAAGDASLRALFPQPLHSEAPHAQVIRDRAPLNIADAQTDPRVPEAVQTSARGRGYRSWVTVPLLSPDGAVGTIAVTRREPGGFTDDEIALLKTFADQAVIAIENVRLFTELQEKNRALTQAHAQITETLERQTATSEILSVISSSPTDVQPVFDTIVRSAPRLCGAKFCILYRFDGECSSSAPLGVSEGVSNRQLSG